ncbi:hypothetical protein RB595_010512 [Gaeumannomyces hyphopodioides]
MTELLKEMQRNVDVHVQVYNNVEKHFAQILRKYEGDQHEDHRKLAMSIEEVVLGHLRLQMLGDKERPRSPSRSPPRTQLASPTTSSGGSRPAQAPEQAPTTRAPPESTTRTWATVASAKGPEPAAAPPKPAPKPGPRANKQSDHRILVRARHPGLDKREPFALRHKTSEAVGVSLADIPAVMRTPTEWAIRPANATIKAKLLEPPMQEEIKKIFDATSITVPQKWYNYAVPDVPRTIHTPWGGEPLDVPQYIKEEVKIQSGLEPVDCKPSRHGHNVETGTATWIISFLQPAPRLFSLFGTSGKSRLVVKKPKIELHASGCQGYCDARRCVRPKRCGCCSRDIHEGDCSDPPKCANCCGPFPAGHTGCPAAPRVENNEVVRLSQRKLRDVRKHGQGRYKKALEAAAEAAEKAAAEATAKEAPPVDATMIDRPPTTHTGKRGREETGAGAILQFLTPIAPPAGNNDTIIVSTHATSPEVAQTQPQHSHE